MPYKDPEKEREYHRNYKRKWIERNRERYNKYIKEWREKNNEHLNEIRREKYWLNREKEIIRVMEGNKRRYRRQRVEVIEHYGGKCVCCGEDRIHFLGIDHINGNGGKHRKELRENSKGQKYNALYPWLIKNNFPDGFRVLCHNCNLSIGFYGFCPHQVEKGELSEEQIVEIEYQNSLRRKRKYNGIQPQLNTC